jgi:pimeloyl-ACP methyl ester carboxylesterase
VDPTGLVDIFIEGATAPFITPPVASYFSTYHSVQPDSAYFTFNQNSEIASFINSQPASEPINIVGHSYGANTAAQVAGVVNRPVDLLITIDPVGYSSAGNFVANVSNWINVTAAPNSTNFSDIIASVGGKGGNLPVNEATSTYSLNTNHANFSTMMNFQPPEMASPASILGLSTSPNMQGLGSIINPFSGGK